MNFNFLLTLIMTFCFMCYGEPIYAETIFTNPAEKWVIEQIQINGVADLKKQFPKENDRRVRSIVVEHVLTILGDRGGFVTIQNAVFVDSFGLGGINIKQGVMLQNCIFLDSVKIVNVESKGLILEGGIFNGPVEIIGSNIHHLSFTGSYFKSSVIILDTEIDGRLNLSNAHFESLGDDIKFTGVVVKGDVGLANSTFNGSVMLNSTHIYNSLVASGTTFQKSATFNLVKIEENAYFDKAAFHGPFDFMQSQVGKNLIVNNAIFWDKKTGANFNGIMVNGSAFFKGKVQFKGPVDFQNAQIKSNLEADGAQFSNPETVANFAGISIGKQLLIPKATFSGGVIFNSASIKSDLYAAESHFNSSSQKASFNSIEIGGNAIFVKAVFKGPFDFGQAQIDKSLNADDANFWDKKTGANFNGIMVNGSAFFRGKVQFKGPVDFQNAKIKSNLELDGAQFSNPEAEANFAGIRVGDQLRIPNATFSGGASFNTASIESAFSAKDAKFLNEKSIANFNSINVGGAVLFEGKVQFKGPVDFQSAQIKLNLDLSGAKFLNPEAKADFGEISVGKQLRIPNVIFSGGANFNSASIESHLFAPNSHFKEIASFNSVKIGGTLIFDENTEFYGPVDFQAAQIGMNFLANGAKFLNKSEGLKCGIMRVGFETQLDGAQFEGPVNLNGVRVGNTFSAEGAHFNAKDTTFGMNAMSVTGNFLLQNAVFASPLSLNATSIVGSLKADSAEFRGYGHSLSLDNTKILGNTTLSAASISGELSLVGAEFSDLFIGGNQPEILDLKAEGFPMLKRLVLSGSNVNGKLTIQDVTADEFYMSELNVKGPTNIVKTMFLKKITLENSHLNTISIIRVKWPNDPSKFGFRGVNYQGLEVGCSGKVTSNINKKPTYCQPSSKEVINLLEDIRYDSSTYLDYENSLMRQGRAEEADNVFIARKERERRENNSWISNAWDLFLFYSVAYGRHPEYSIGISALLISIGIMIFKEQNMVSANEDPKIPYSRFWFSIDRFLPIIGDFHAEEKWFPKKEKKWLLWYWRFLPYSGWLLLPLILAGSTGLLK